ncbi:hypothetical protein BO71DRAFT_408397 [Aspergillus ellipticus CBS 707.79]|uniref:Uncharacterized protein n=1 Tax=Aspergillus ellipticus CBS 707.79 TaxID=1448320 RepID=A0A319DE98_9EURO|nr:hypothetical protein BO71DRAFT_408397 [Aspergillus ellipticus CBS 707.79]
MPTESPQRHSSVSSIHSLHNRAQYEALDQCQGQPVAEPKPKAGADSKAKVPKKSGWVEIQEWHVLEILGMLLAAGALIATVIILRSYDQKPQPVWHYMSLNSLISWLSTISKACILFSVSEALGQLKWVWFAQARRPLPNLEAFDSASRGLYGSALLIWMLKGRHFAIWGSLAMILALGYDPCVQNLVHYYSQLTEDAHQQAFVANSSTYTAYGSGGMLASDPWVDPVLKGNVYNALFNLDDSRPWATPHYVCSSGNCTWDPVAALGARALCSDVTHFLQAKNATVEGEGTELKNTVFLPNSTVMVWFNSTLVGDQVYMAVGAVNPTQALVYTNATYEPIQFIAPLNVNSTTGDDHPALESISQFKATECSLEPTVRSFNASVQNSVYQEKTLAVWSQDMRHLSSLQRRGAQPAFKGSPPGWGAAQGMQFNQTFLIDDSASTALGTFLEYLFTGSYRITGHKTRLQVEDSEDGNAYATADTIQALMMGNMTGCSPYTTEKFACAMQNVAAAVSKSFRDSAYIAAGSDIAGANMTEGRGLISQTFVEVHWQWIALPVVVWALGVLTLVGTAWKTRRSRVPTWQNSPMPLLYMYRGRDEDVRNGEGGKLSEGFISGSEDVRVMLCKENNRFTLS